MLLKINITMFSEIPSSATHPNLQSPTAQRMPLQQHTPFSTSNDHNYVSSPSAISFPIISFLPQAKNNKLQTGLLDRSMMQKVKPSVPTVHSNHPKQATCMKDIPLPNAVTNN